MRQPASAVHSVLLVIAGPAMKIGLFDDALRSLSPRPFAPQPDRSLLRLWIFNRIADGKRVETSTFDRLSRFSSTAKLPYRECDQREGFFMTTIANVLPDSPHSITSFVSAGLSDATTDSCDCAG